MANITPTVGINVEEELKNLSQYKYHPNGIINVSLNRLSEILDGKVEILEPSNPFTYLLETLCLNTSFAIQENTILTKRLYPRLANNEKDLYLHMSDKDYLDRFSTPAYGEISFNFLLSDILTKGYYDGVNKEHILQLPKHSKVSVGEYVFLLSEAVIIRVSDTKVIDVRYAPDGMENYFPPNTDYISYNLFNMSENDTYISFKLLMPEIDIEATEIPVEKSKLFASDLTYKEGRKFYAARAFYQVSGVWKEMVVTQTNDVYDINTPTCVVQVDQSKSTVSYRIPPVYINTGMVTGKVKIIVYTTMGAINVNFRNFLVGDFSYDYNPVFKLLELNNYTEALSVITRVIYAESTVVGGTDGVTFEELKRNVIENSIGDRKLPITEAQLTFDSETLGFTAIKDSDDLINRLYLLESGVPSYVTETGVDKLDLDILEYLTTADDLRNNNNNNIILSSANLTVIPKGTLFKKDDTLKILSATDYTTLTGLSGNALVSVLNSNKYYSTFYHYVLDTSDNAIDLRAYDIDTVTSGRVNFMEYNSNSLVTINTIATYIKKTSFGYSMIIVSSFKSYNATVTPADITPYIVMIDDSGSQFFLEGQIYVNPQLTLEPGTVAYTFDIQSDYAVNNRKEMLMKNFTDASNNVNPIYIPIKSDLNILYLSSKIPTNYVASNLDNEFGATWVMVGNCAVTLESIEIKFADELEMLFRRTRAATNVPEYQTYATDVVAKYTHTVYDTSNNIIHYPNETVLDGNGDPVIQYHAGDPVLDVNGNPVPVEPNDIAYFLNFLLIDYKTVVASTDDILSFKDKTRSYLTSQIVDNAPKVKSKLLGNTDARVIIPKTIEDLMVKTEVGIYNIPPAQPFVVNVFINELYYNDSTAKANITNLVQSLISNYLSTNTQISKTELLDILFNALKEFITSISIGPLTNKNVEYIRILTPSGKLTLKKKLEYDGAKYLLKNDVQVNFILA